MEDWENKDNNIVDGQIRMEELLTNEVDDNSQEEFFGPIDGQISIDDFVSSNQNTNNKQLKNFDENNPKVNNSEKIVECNTTESIDLSYKSNKKILPIINEDVSTSEINNEEDDNIVVDDKNIANLNEHEYNVKLPPTEVKEEYKDEDTSNNSSIDFKQDSVGEENNYDMQEALEEEGITLNEISDDKIEEEMPTEQNIEDNTINNDLIKPIHKHKPKLTKGDDFNKVEIDDDLRDFVNQQGDKTIEESIENNNSQNNESNLFCDIHKIKIKEKKMAGEYNSTGGTTIDGLLFKTIDEVLHESMIPYSEHVILDRALPRVEDGLKPVQRRILYSMLELGVTPDKPYRKSARIVGDCMGKYHPHGDSSVYDAMVKLAQPFNTNGLLVDGHGNFGSIDGDNAAAMRYTEARLTPLALELLRDLDKDTVKWNLNFDDTQKEPDILPGRYPNLLVNGCQGIAVGLATNIPPHNLGEVIDGVVAYIDNNRISLKEMLKIIKGPDFPTGAYITNGTDLEQIYSTGKGKLTIRAKFHIETQGDKNNIVITELPYQVNKVALLQKIATLRDEKKELACINDIRDESDRTGIRAVIKLKKDANVNKVIEILLKSTNMQTTFGVNMVAIADGKPKQMGLMEIISYYVEYQRQIIYRRSKFECEQAKEREHILSGLLIAIKNINEVIRIIKTSKNTTEAKERLRAKFVLSERQAQAIMDMRLSRLTNLEVNKLEEEIKALRELIKNLTAIIASKKLQFEIVKKEILAIKRNYKRERQTEIFKSEDKLRVPRDTDEEEVKEVIVATNALNNIKSIGRKYYNMAQKEFTDNSTLNEVHTKLIKINSDKNLLIFTNLGNCYKVKVSSLTESRFKDKGVPYQKAIPNMLSNELIVGMIPESLQDVSLMFVTKTGMLKKSSINEYKISKSSFPAIKLKDKDEVLNVDVALNSTLLLLTKQGMTLNVKLDDVADIGRVSMGVIGINLNSGDEVVFGDFVADKKYLTFVSDTGIIKKVAIKEFEPSSRNRKGVKVIGVDGGKYVMTATIDDNATIIADNGEYQYKQVCNCSVDTRTSKGKPIGKKKGKLNNAYVYNLI